MMDMQACVEEVAGRKVLYVIRGEQVVQLDTMYDQESLLEGWAERLQGLYNSTYLVFGLGNGMFVREILRRGGDSIRVFVYEPSAAIYQTAAENFDLSDILSDERFEMLLAEEEEGENTLFYRFAKLIDYEGFAGIRMCEYVNYDLLFPEELAYFYQKKEEVCDSVRSNRSVNERFGRRFMENTFYNAPYLINAYSFQSLQCYLEEDLPVIIVSSGPSLNKNVSALKAAKGKALIISADSAMSVLLNNGIIPDLYICTDPKKHPKHFDYPEVKDIPVLCDLETAKVALADHRAPVFMFEDNDVYVDSFLLLNGIELPKINSGGSVANSAMSAFLEIGVKKFILVGQDLAYTGNKSHADGSLRSTWNLDLSVNQVFVEGQSGEMVASSSEFVLYRDWFERQIANRPEITVINATEGGARIHGAEEMPLTEAINLFCKKERDAAETLSLGRFILGSTLRSLYADHMRKVPASLAEVEQVLRKSLREYGEMEDMVLARNYHTKRFQTLYQHVSATNEDLEGEPALPYAECLVQSEITAFMKNAYDVKADEREELREIITRGQDYDKLILGACREAKDIIGTICEEMKPVYEKELAVNRYNLGEEKAVLFYEDTLALLEPSADYELLKSYIDKYSPNMKSSFSGEDVQLLIASLKKRVAYLRSDALNQKVVLEAIIGELTDKEDGHLRVTIQQITGRG